VSSAEEARKFEDVVLCHFDLVYRLALKLTHDQHEAEDLVQETFLKAHRAFSGFELRGYGARPWLLKILHNVYLTRRGRAGRSPTLLDDISLDDIAAELERSSPMPGYGSAHVNWEDFDDELKAAVQALSPDYRSVLMLWALGDLSYKEIADVLGCAVGTVMSRLFRARHQLGETLAEYAQKRNIRPKGPGSPGAN
jgi:RNA polymerase sigma-70 factor (ECF subfamily)